MLLGVLTYSLGPLLAYWPAIHAHRATIHDWKVIATQTAFLQVALWFATKRCRTENFSFWEGVSLVASYMRTGWIYSDLLVGGISVFCLLIIADFIALSTRPQLLHYRILQVFYNHRLRQ